MNKMPYFPYQAPQLTVLDLAVEQGFTVSGTIEDAETDQWGDY